MKSLSKLNVFVFCGAALLSAFASNAGAEWIKATGQAPILDGDYERARKVAQEDALRQAALMVQANVSSLDEMKMGVITKSHVSVTTRARAERVRLIEEKVEEDMLYLTLEADMRELPACADGTANGYRKKVALLGFSIQHPQQAALGGLYNIDRALPSYLSRLLSAKDGLMMHESSRLGLYEEPVNAPSRETEQRTLTKSVDLARDIGVQFVVSGVIRDLSVENSESLSRSFLNDSLRTFGWRDSLRMFDIELFIHDGFSGAILYQKRYQTQGNWESSAEKQAPFGSVAFWEQGYGNSVNDILNNVADDVHEHLICQPFMARITKVEGKHVLFEAGANAGVRPGDKLQVYRSRPLYQGERFQGTDLKDMQLALVVKQVQPEFATGNVTIDPTRMNVQTDDVLIAW